MHFDRQKLLLMFFVFLSSVANAQYQYSSKEENFATYFHIYKEASKLHSGPFFWFELQSANKKHAKLAKARNANGKTIQEVNEEFEIMCNELRSCFASLRGSQYRKDLTDSIMSWTGVGNYYRDVRMFILPTADCNAYTYPTGHIIFTEKLTDIMDRDELLGAAAHELAHYVLEHWYAETYRTRKKEKRNRFWAEMGAMLYVGVTEGANVYGASQGATPIDTHSGEIYPQLQTELEREADKASTIFKFRYSREQELEADIIALAFLVKSGVDGNKMITMLEKLRSYAVDERADKYSTHPLLSERIATIKYILNKIK